MLVFISRLVAVCIGFAVAIVLHKAFGTACAGVVIGWVTIGHKLRQVVLPQFTNVMRCGGRCLAIPGIAMD